MYYSQSVKKDNQKNLETGTSRLPDSKLDGDLPEMFKPSPKPGYKKGFNKHDTIQNQDRRCLSKLKKKLIVKLLGEGKSMITTATIVHSDQSTVKQVAEICHESIEERRKKLAGRLHSIVAPLLDRVQSQILDKNLPTSTKDLSISAGIFIDKIERLTGQVTQVIKIEESNPTKDDYMRWVQTKTIDAEICTKPIEDSTNKPVEFIDASLSLSSLSTPPDSAPAEDEP